MHFRRSSRACRERRRVDQALQHRRRREEEAALPRVDAAHDLRGIEAARCGDHVDGAARDMRDHVQARTVRQRRRMQDRVAGRDGLDVGQKTLRHREQVAVSDLHALGPAGGAARVEQPRRRRPPLPRPVRPGDGCATSRSYSDAAERDCAPEFRHVAGEMRQRALPRLVDERARAHRCREHERELLRMQLRVDRHRNRARPTSSANSASMYCGALRDTSATRSPGATPAECKPAANPAARRQSDA